MLNFTTLLQNLITFFIALLTGFSVGTMSLLIAGCAQSTDTPVDVVSQAVTPSDLGQITDQFGNATRENPPRAVFIGVANHVHVRAPISNDAPVPLELLIAGEQPLAQEGEGESATHHMEVGTVTIHFTQHTEADSGQDAAQTGTVQPGVSVAQAPTTTVTPTQEVEPAIAIDVPIGLWGGIAQGAATAAKEGTATTTTTQDAMTRWLQALTEKLADPDFRKTINELLGLDDDDEPEPEPEPKTEPESG